MNLNLWCLGSTRWDSNHASNGFLRGDATWGSSSKSACMSGKRRQTTGSIFAGTGYMRRKLSMVVFDRIILVLVVWSWITLAVCVLDPKLSPTRVLDNVVFQLVGVFGWLVPLFRPFLVVPLKHVLPKRLWTTRRRNDNRIPLATRKNPTRSCCNDIAIFCESGGIVRVGRLVVFSRDTRAHFQVFFFTRNMAGPSLAPIDRRSWLNASTK